MKTLSKTLLVLFCMSLMMSCSSNRKVSSVAPAEHEKQEENRSEPNPNWEMNLIRAFR